MRTGQQTLKRNFRLLYTIDFFANSAFTLPIYILFGREYLNVSYFQAGLLFTLGWFVSLAFDFLGGVAADKFGRKQAYLMGIAIQAVSFLPYLFTKNYALLLLSSVITGIGIALGSNSVDAIVYEQATDQDAKQQYQHANANTQAFVFLGRIYATILGGIAYNADPRLPYLLYTVALLVAMLAGTAIKVDGKINDAEQPNYTTIIKEALGVYKHNLWLVKFIVIGALVSVWGDLMFGFYQPFFINHDVSSTTLGFVFAGISFASVIGSLIMRRLPNHASAHLIQSIQLLGVMSTAILLVILKLPITLVVPMLMGLISGFALPNLRLYVNGHTNNNVRASVLSFATTTFGIGSGIGLLLAFSLADHFSPNSVFMFVVAGSLVTLLANLFVRPRRPETPLLDLP